MADKPYGFTLVEVLGVVACVAVLATVALVSTKDAVSAGRTSALQRDLQGLNTALVNFQSAGGAIPRNADAKAAVQSLMVGTQLGGETFKPLMSEPQFFRPMGETTFFLFFDPDTGFSYRAANPADGGYAGAGSRDDSQGAPFVFDISSGSAFATALPEFLSLSPDDPDFESYLRAFSTARQLGTLDPLALDELDSLMLSQGWAFDPVTSNYSPRTYMGMRAIPSEPLIEGPSFLEGTLEYTPGTLVPAWSNDEWAWVADALKTDERDYWWNEINSAYRQAGPGSQTFSLSPEGEVLVRRLGVSNIDWLDIDTSGMSLAGVDVTGSNLTVQHLNRAGYINAVRASGMDLTSLQTFGKALYASDFTGATIDVMQLVNSGGIDFLTLRGAQTPLGQPITYSMVVDALLAAGKIGQPGFNPDTLVF
jgi:type II secretory pathway pseudopilin PulG